MKSTLRLLLLAVIVSSHASLHAGEQVTVKRELPNPAVAANVKATAGHPIPARPPRRPRKNGKGLRSEDVTPGQTAPISASAPVESKMKKAGGFRFDLRNLPQTPPARFERPDREAPFVAPAPVRGGTAPTPNIPFVPTANGPAPSTVANFDGLDFANWGDGHPPDTNGDVGPTYYIQTINTSIGVYRKSDHVRVAAFSFNTFMSQGHFGNLCDTDNFGDPVVLYDSFEDRWIITDFAFQLDGASNVINPPGSFQCFAASMSGDPVAGGWNFYSINTAGGLGDYPKLGIWPDGLYMMVNMFDYAATGGFLNPRMYALNKAQMYAGNASIQVVSFDAPPAEFTILPANARLQNGTPPAGSPNYCAVVWQFVNAVSIYKFHVDWDRTSLSSFTGPFLSVTPTSWGGPSDLFVPSLNGNALDALPVRLMMQNQYTNQTGVESLWMSHTVEVGTTAAPRVYQVDVTGGTVAPSTTQAFNHTPDTTMNRFMPSLAVDRAGDMAIGYSTSSAASFPAIKYAGRLSTDPLSSLPQTEVTMMSGTGTQSGSCGGTCERWGDYSAMSLDPDGCTFWYTNEYYATTGLNFLTRIGSFAFPSCTPVGAGGTLQGTVTAAVGGAPISGATVALGARTTTTNGSGVYSFSGIPAGTYASVSGSKPGFFSQTTATIIVTESGTTTKDFALTAAPPSGCLTDTTQADFQTGAVAGVDLVASPGDAVLVNAANIDQVNTSVANPATFDSTNWFGQTFTAGITGQLTAVDVDMACNLCSGVTPNVTISIQATSGNLPVGPDLATASIPFSSATAGYLNAAFVAPLNVTAGTQYAIVVRAAANPASGTYTYFVSGGTANNPYLAGRRVISVNSGGTWTAPNLRDIGFRTYVNPGYPASGTFTSASKDSNPAVGLSPIWSTLSWTKSTPSGTSIQFQVAGSNSAGGPFTFAGPDGTSASFFTTSGASLAQFSGLRYLQYKAVLSTTSNAVTPALNDVTMCFTTLDCSSLSATITPTAGPVCHDSGGHTTSGPAGATSYSWSIANGVITGGATSQTVTYTAGASGNVTLNLTTFNAAGCRKTDTVNVPIGAPIPTPSTIPDGIVGTSYSVTLGSTGGTGTVTFGVTGNVPPGLQLSSGILSGMPTVAGTYTITISAVDANGCTGSRNYTFTIAGAAGTPPANMTATASSTTQAAVTWTRVATATSYDVIRTAPGGGVVTASTAATSYVDPGLTPGTTYVYRVQAFGPGFPVNAISAPDIATTILFADDPLVAGSTLIKGVHLTDLRTAVNAVRAAAGMGTIAFTDPAPSGVIVKASHIQDLRSALDLARSTIGVPALTYSNPATSGTPIRAVDLTELRNGVK
jgi:hypothetical protein